MITVKHHGDWTKTQRFLEKSKGLGIKINSILTKYGSLGVQMLSLATPKDSGKTASSWSYEITKDDRGYRIYWTNDSANDGVSIALLLQYGHGLQNGSFVEGRDYINPAMRPVFDNLSASILEEVSNL